MIAFLLACQHTAPPQVFAGPVPELPPFDLPEVPPVDGECPEAVELVAGDVATCHGVLLPMSQAESLRYRVEQRARLIEALRITREGRAADRLQAQAVVDALWRDAEDRRRREQLQRVARPVEWGAVVVLTLGAVGLAARL